MPASSSFTASPIIVVAVVVTVLGFLSFGVRSCQVWVDKPRRVRLDLIHTDPLVHPFRVLALADPNAGVDLARVVIGRTETGRPWVPRLLGRHILVAGVSDAGKSSVMWAVLPSGVG